MNLSPQELRTLASLIERLQGTAKPRALPSAKRRPQSKASTPKPPHAPPAAQASASPAPADDEAKKAARRAKWNAQAKARRERKRKAKAAKPPPAPHAPPAELVEGCKLFTRSELAAASKLSQAICRDLQLGRACAPVVIEAMTKAVADLREATGK